MMRDAVFLLLLVSLVLACSRSYRGHVPPSARDLEARPFLPPPTGPSAARASPAGRPSGRLDLARAVAIALERNPDLAVAAERLAAAESLQAAARGAFFPTLSLDFAALRADAPSTYLFKRIDQRELEPGTDFNDPGRITNYEMGVTLRYELFRGGRDAANLEMAREDRQLARLDRESVRNELIAGVTLTFHDIIISDELKAAEAAAVETVAAQVSEARKRLDAGAILKDEVLSLEVRRAEAEDRFIAARNAGRLARAALASLLAMDPTGAEGLECSDVPPPGVPERYETGLALARARSPDLAAARRRRSKAGMAIARAASGLYPTIGVFGRYYHDDERFGFNRNDANWILGADLTWPVFSGFATRHRTAAAEAGERAAEAAVRRAELNLEQRVRTAYIRLDDARSRRKVTGAAVAHAAETLDLVTKRYAAGAATITRYLAAEQDRTLARVNAIRARCQERRALAEVARVLGWWTTEEREGGIMSGSKGRALVAVGKWIVGIGILLALMVYLAGVLTPDRIEAGWAPSARPPQPSGETVAAGVRSIPVFYEAVGTVQSRRRFEVAAQTGGRILEIAVREGNRVEKGALLARIESDVLEARREQALRARDAAAAAERATADLVSGAGARFTRAEAERARARKLFEEKAATARQMEAADAEFLEAKAALDAARARLAGAKADVAGADGRVRETEVALAYTRVVAPQAGEVVRRHVDSGDLAWAGRPLVVLHDPRDLRLEAAVREGLVGRATVGAKVRAHIEALGLDVDGTVDEVVPSADPLSRTFLVKVSIPYREGLLTGMFGRLRLPLGERRTVLVSARAVRRIGQLEQVRVLDAGRVSRRLVRTGPRHDGEVEVLSGLDGGETLVIEEVR